MRHQTGVIVVLALGLLMASGAHAAYLYPWHATPNFSDPAGDAAPSADLTNMHWARDGGFDFWRMDLSAPATVTNGQFYGAFVDITAGTFWAPSELPPGVPYADFFLGMESLGGVWVPVIGNGVTQYYSNPMVQGQVTMNGGTSVEFKLDSSLGMASAFGRDYTWAGVSGITSTLPLIGHGNTLYDYTDGRNTLTDTPEPTTLVLLPLGCGLLLRRLRGRRGKAA